MKGRGWRLKEEEFVARTLLREELVWLVSKEVTVTERRARRENSGEKREAGSQRKVQALF